MIDGKKAKLSVGSQFKIILPLNTFQLVKRLLEMGSDIDAVAKNRGALLTTPLLCAIYGYCRLADDAKTRERKEESENISVMNYLIEKGCNINSYGEDNLTALHLCCSYMISPGFLNDLLPLLLDHGGDMYSTAGGEDPPVDEAIQNDNMEALWILLDAGCNVSNYVKNAIISACKKYITPKEGIPLVNSVTWLNQTNTSVDDWNEDDYFKRDEEFESIRKAIRNINHDLDGVRSLKWMCRRVIRSGPSSPRAVVKSLHLPSTIRKYLLCHKEGVS